MKQVYIGMDVHDSTFNMCSLIPDFEDGRRDDYFAELQIEGSTAAVEKYVKKLRKQLKGDYEFRLGYEAGCLGYTLCRNLLDKGLSCVILAPTSMKVEQGGNKVKTDRRDARKIAHCLAYKDYSPVHMLSIKDEFTRDYIRCRNDHVDDLKHTKQRINAFCLRYGFKYRKTKWTGLHLNWLNSLVLEPEQREVMDEYLQTYNQLKTKIAAQDVRIHEYATSERYAEDVQRLVCIAGIQEITALSIIVEVGDFKRFKTAAEFSAFLGLVPSEHTSSTNQKRGGITKSGNTHLRKLLTESAQSYGRITIKTKSVALKKRQEGQPQEVIDYADKARERIRRKFVRMQLNHHKPWNVAVTAAAREISCFVWGMMTGNISNAGAAA